MRRAGATGTPHTLASGVGVHRSTLSSDALGVEPDDVSDSDESNDEGMDSDGLEELIGEDPSFVLGNADISGQRDFIHF